MTVSVLFFKPYAHLAFYHDVFYNVTDSFHEHPL
jgi:hypothetical protein